MTSRTQRPEQSLLRRSRERRRLPEITDADAQKQPHLLVPRGRCDVSLKLSELQADCRDVPKAEDHVLEAGHFALDTETDRTAQLVLDVMRA